MAFYMNFNKRVGNADPPGKGTAPPLHPCCIPSRPNTPLFVCTRPAFRVFFTCVGSMQGRTLARCYVASGVFFDTLAGAVCKL